MPAAIPDAGERIVLGHPAGLFVLFFTEMWERFSYYGMRALLIFYLIDHWGFTEDRAYIIYGSYTALVYIAPAVGGYLADRCLGANKAVGFGAVLLVCGHALLAAEGDIGQAGPGLFWAALSFVIVGTGFLKANVSVLVGSLYAGADRRREPAFTIFYIGINIGAALGAIVAGYLGQTFGWHWGFGAAGLAMAAGLGVFLWGQPALRGCGAPPEPARLAARRLGIRQEAWVYIGGLCGVACVWWLIQVQQLVGLALGAGGALVIGYILVTATFRLSAAERNAIFHALALILLSILFWAFFEQAGSSLNLYTERHVDRALFGRIMPASVFQSLTAINIVLFGPVVAWLWLHLARRGREPSALCKFGIGLVLLGAGFLVLAAGARAAGSAPTPLYFIMLLYLFHTLGELCVSPTGLAAMTRLAPAQMVGLLMGSWFLASAAGNFAAGLIARASGGDGTHVIATFATVGWVAGGTGLAVVLLASASLWKWLFAAGAGAASAR